jgi:hypothetical protein
MLPWILCKEFGLIYCYSYFCREEMEVFILIIRSCLTEEKHNERAVSTVFEIYTKIYIYISVSYLVICDIHS